MMNVTKRMSGIKGMVFRSTVNRVIGPKITPKGGNCCTSGSMNLKASVNGKM
jgi:hypothetical protein